MEGCPDGGWGGGRFECQTGKEVALGVLGRVSKADPEILRRGGYAGWGWGGGREPSGENCRGERKAREQGQKLSKLWL